MVFPARRAAWAAWAGPDVDRLGVHSPARFREEVRDFRSAKVSQVPPDAPPQGPALQTPQPPDALQKVVHRCRCRPARVAVAQAAHQVAQKAQLALEDEVVLRQVAVARAQGPVRPASQQPERLASPVAVASQQEPRVSAQRVPAQA
jgi:hypothetical protein